MERSCCILEEQKKLMRFLALFWLNFFILSLAWHLSFEYLQYLYMQVLWWDSNLILISAGSWIKMFSLFQLVLLCTMNWQFNEWSYERKDHKFTSRDSLLLVYGILVAHKSSSFCSFCMCSMYKHKVPISRSSCIVTLARSKHKPNKSKKGKVLCVTIFNIYSSKLGIFFLPS